MFWNCEIWLPPYFSKLRVALMNVKAHNISVGSVSNHTEMHWNQLQPWSKEINNVILVCCNASSDGAKPPICLCNLHREIIRRWRAEEMTKKGIVQARDSCLYPSLCCCVNNVICRGMWVSGALLFPGDQRHSPTTHSYLIHSLSLDSFPCLPHWLARRMTSCIFHKVCAFLSIFHPSYWQASESQPEGVTAPCPVCFPFLHLSLVHN